MGAPSVVSVEGDKPVIEYLLRKSAKENDWVSIEKICEDNTQEINSTDFSLWARSKFMLGKFADCYEVCYKSYTNNKENVPLDSENDRLHNFHQSHFFLGYVHHTF